MKAHIGDYVRVMPVNDFFKVTGIRTIYAPKFSEFYATTSGAFAFEDELTNGDVIQETEYNGLHGIKNV